MKVFIINYRVRKVINIVKILWNVFKLDLIGFIMKIFIIDVRVFFIIFFFYVIYGKWLYYIY